MDRPDKSLRVYSGRNGDGPGIAGRADIGYCPRGAALAAMRLPKKFAHSGVTSWAVHFRLIREFRILHKPSFILNVVRAAVPGNGSAAGAASLLCVIGRILYFGSC